MEQKTSDSTRQANKSCAGTLTRRIGRTTFVINLHFSDKKKDTYEDVAKKLMIADLDDYKTQ